MNNCGICLAADGWFYGGGPVGQADLIVAIFGCVVTSEPRRSSGQVIEEEDWFYFFDGMDGMFSIIMFYHRAARRNTKGINCNHGFSRINTD